MTRFIVTELVAVVSASFMWLTIGPLPPGGYFLFGVVIGVLGIIVKVDRLLRW